MLPVLRQYTNYSERNARPYYFMALIGSGFELVTDKREEKTADWQSKNLDSCFDSLAIILYRVPQPFLTLISCSYCNQVELGHVSSILSLGIPSIHQKTIAHPLKMIGFR